MTVSRPPVTFVPALPVRGHGLARLAHAVRELLRPRGPAPRRRHVRRDDLLRGAGRTP